MSSRSAALAAGVPIPSWIGGRLGETRDGKDGNDGLDEGKDILLLLLTRWSLGGLCRSLRGSYWEAEMEGGGRDLVDVLKTTNSCP